MAGSSLTQPGKVPWATGLMYIFKWRKTLMLLMSFLLVVWVFNSCLFKGCYIQWIPSSLPRRNSNSKYFTLGRNQDIYMYSAHVKLKDCSDNSRKKMTQIVITSLDRSRVTFYCCVLFNDNKTMYSTPASIYFRTYPQDIQTETKLKEYFRPTIYVARQHTCWVPESSTLPVASYVTLTTTFCSTDLRDYLPLVHPPPMPGQIALCGKIAHSGGLEPNKVIEWFEFQRLMGVDKILMFDLGNPEELNRVFRYYQNLGLLDLQPYELPGYPTNRSLKEELKRTNQFKQDETLAVLECRQRMAGYDYVISHDVDEFIVPREDVTLKELFKNLVEKHPNAAGFYFHTQFFITTWKPSNPKEELMVKRYTKSTVPRMEAYKYVYLPSRTVTSVTHELFPIEPFKGIRTSADDVVLHHYRECPKDTWGHCSPTKITDGIMDRYHDLDERVREVKKATLKMPKS